MEWFIFSILSSFQSIKRFEIPVWGSAESSHYLSLKCSSFPKDSTIFHSVQFDPATTYQPPVMRRLPMRHYWATKEGREVSSVRIRWGGYEGYPSVKVLYNLCIMWMHSGNQQWLLGGTGIGIEPCRVAPNGGTWADRVGCVQRLRNMRYAAFSWGSPWLLPLCICCVQVYYLIQSL